VTNLSPSDVRSILSKRLCKFRIYSEIDVYALQKYTSRDGDAVHDLSYECLIYLNIAISHNFMSFRCMEYLKQKVMLHAHYF
jgi:hypothetical protein